MGKNSQGAIVLYLVPIEAEEDVLGLEIANLQEAIDLRMQAWSAAGERQFGFCQRQIFQPLHIVEVRQAVQGFLLGVRQDDQSLALCDHHALLWRSLYLLHWPAIMLLFGFSSHGITIAPIIGWMVIGATLTAALLAFRWLEQPARHAIRARFADTGFDARRNAGLCSGSAD